jgi:lysophospholipase L1-like esterase
MDRWLPRIARLVGTAIGALAGVIAIQLMRLRRMEFLPGHPGFYINHVVRADGAAPTERRLRLVVLGDSTTAGVGVDRPEDSLPYRLARRIAAAERRDVHVVSYGWAGARVVDLVRQQLPRALEPLRASESEPFLPGADIVAVVIGANDATHRTSPGRFRADLRATLSVVRDGAPSARVVLAGIPTFRGALPGVEPLIFLADQYAGLLRPIGRSEAARLGIAYADLATELPDRLRGRSDIFAPDGFHPSAIGYAAWADVIADALGDGPAAATPSVDSAGA